VNKETSKLRDFAFGLPAAGCAPRLSKTVLSSCCCPGCLVYSQATLKKHAANIQQTQQQKELQHAPTSTQQLQQTPASMQNISQNVLIDAKETVRSAPAAGCASRPWKDSSTSMLLLPRLLQN
jgi:hypothetical protein